MACVSTRPWRDTASSFPICKQRKSSVSLTAQTALRSSCSESLCPERVWQHGLSQRDNSYAVITCSDNVKGEVGVLSLQMDSQQCTYVVKESMGANSTATPVRFKDSNESLQVSQINHVEQQEESDLMTDSDSVWLEEVLFPFLSLKNAVSVLYSIPTPIPTPIFRWTLSKCGGEKQLTACRLVYLHICNNGIDSLLSYHIIATFLDCGSIPDAQQVLDRFLSLDCESCNCFISRCLRYGEWQLAFNAYKKMQAEDFCLSRYIIMDLLKFSARLKCLEVGLQLHISIIKESWEDDSFLMNTLLRMYVSCGLMAEAWDVFNEFRNKDMVMWSMIIRGFSDLDLYVEVLECFQQRLADGIHPDATILICSLKACKRIGSCEVGWIIHDEIVKYGFEKHLHIGNALVDMYARCGLTVETRKVFYRLPIQDVMSWTSLIAGYADCVMLDEALTCFRQMQHVNLSPNVAIFVSLLKVCGDTGTVEKAQHMHAEIIKNELEHEVVVGTTLVDMYMKFGMTLDAQETFSELPVHNVISWTTLIGGYVDCGLLSQAYKCFKSMHLDGVAPNDITFLCVLKACETPADCEKGKLLHDQIVKRGFESNIKVSSALVDMYCKCGLFSEAEHLFLGFPDKSLVFWTSLLAGYTCQERCAETLMLFEQMQREKVYPDAKAFIYALKACGICGAIEKSQVLFSEALMKGFDKNICVMSAVVHMYANLGLLVEAQQVFDMVEIQDVGLWNALVIGYAEHQFVEHALGYLEVMEQKGVVPGVAIFVYILRACSDTAHIKYGQAIHAEITKRGLDVDCQTIKITVVKMYTSQYLFTEALHVCKELPSLENSSLLQNWILRLC